MRILLAAACLLAALSFACGGDNDSNEDEEAAVESVIRAYFQRYIDSDIEGIYQMLDAIGRQACPEDQFVAVMSDIRGAVGDNEIKFLQVSDIVIEAERATVTSELELNGVTDDTENILVKEGSDWKIELRPEVCQG